MKAQYIYINEYGSKEYFSDKEMVVRHREDGPALEWADGDKFWYRDGLVHREDGPAIDCSNGTKKWYRDGLVHREDGPALIYSNGSKYWYIDGVQLTEDAFKARKAPHNGKKVTVDGIEYTLQA
jgi:hypothetical protein